MLNDSQADSSSEDKSCDESDPRASELNSQELQLLVKVNFDYDSLFNFFH
jgi:hypothetical protein